MKNKDPLLNRNKGRLGQAVLEYVLMMALLSTISLGFAAFFKNILFGSGLENLPLKASACMSHPTGKGASSACN